MRDMFICNCQCHTDGSITHCLACCERCAKCRQNIITGFMELHLKECNVLSEEPPEPQMEDDFR